MSLIAEGTLYANLVVNGVAQGMKQIPGVAKFAIQPQNEKKEATSKDKGKYGQVTASVVLAGATLLSLTINEVDGPALGMALMGEVNTLNVAGGTVTDENVTAKLGVFVDLAQRNLTGASVVVQDDTDTTTYIEGTDYEINYALGWIQALPGGAISADQVLHVDYAHGAISGQTIDGSTLTEIRGELVLDGRNLADGKELVIKVDEAILASDSEVDFMSDDFVELELSGNMKTLAGKTKPYTVDYGITRS